MIPCGQTVPMFNSEGANQAFILCSCPPNWARLCDLSACSRALTARLSTLPHGYFPHSAAQAALASDCVPELLRASAVGFVT